MINTLLQNYPFHNQFLISFDVLKLASQPTPFSNSTLTQKKSLQTKLFAMQINRKVMFDPRKTTHFASKWVDSRPNKTKNCLFAPSIGERLICAWQETTFYLQVRLLGWRRPLWTQGVQLCEFYPNLPYHSRKSLFGLAFFFEQLPVWCSFCRFGVSFLWRGFRTQIAVTNSSRIEWDALSGILMTLRDWLWRYLC